VTDLVTIDDALASILDRVQPLASERIPVSDAHGRVLARAAVATIALPPFASSAMDGFAIRAADAPGTLRIAGHVAAGRPATTSLGREEAIGIATGGLVPDGADAVVPIERVVPSDNSVEIGSDVPVGANIRPRGGDVEAGGALVPAGTRLTAAQLGALAAAGVSEIVCGRRPLVRVLTTGSELRSAGDPLAPGEIYESNGLMLEATLSTVGAVVERLPSVPDDEDAHRVAIANGLDADVLVTSGGVSVGPHDLVRRIEREAGIEEVFWGVAVRPGKPVSFGVRDQTLVFGLPGNPVSSLVAAMLFVRPALLALQGSTHPRPEWLTGVLATAVRRAAARDDLLRARSSLAEDGVTLTPVTGQESHMIARTAMADALVHIPRGDGQLAAGASVRYLRLD
jgi:molybdopterin molybdotransferase